MNREVDGILIDTYAGGIRKDLFSKPSIQVAQIIDYQTAYGVVIGGDSMRLRHCFYGYMRSHQAEIFEFVEQLVEPITVGIMQGLVLYSGLNLVSPIAHNLRASSYEPGNRAGVFIWKNFSAGYRDLDNRASSLSHMNTSKFLQRKE